METKTLIDKDKVFLIYVHAYFKELDYKWVEEPNFKYFLGIFRYKNNLRSRFIYKRYGGLSYYDIYLEDTEKDDYYYVEGEKLYQTPFIRICVGNKTIDKHFKTIEALELYLKKFPNCQFNVK